MGILNRIRNVFREEQKITELEISLEDLILRLDKRTDEQNKEITEKSYERIKPIENELDSLKRSIDEFEKLEHAGVLEGSKAVKERFCQYSKNQLDAIIKPSKNLHEIRYFLNNTYSIINNLGGLTPRQLMHIEIFFKADFMPMAKKVREISNMVNETMGIMKSDSEFYGHIKDIHEKMKELDNVIIRKNSYMESLSKEIEKLSKENEQISGEISKIDISDSGAIDELEKNIDLIKQEILSFLSIEKLLKILVHEKGIKDWLLDLYIESPVTALLSDRDMKINHFIKEALKLTEKGDMEVEKKKIDKAKKIIDSTDYLKSKKKELSEAMNELKKKKEYLNNVIAPEIEKKKRRVNEKIRIESNIKNLEKSMEEIPKAIEEAETGKKESKNEIATIASKIMGVKVKIR
ncbi:MAG: hypothetical protein V1900_01090 [Candidatus Aenigmatarchaeota archaeon]